MSSSKKGKFTSIPNIPNSKVMEREREREREREIMQLSVS
jgi:hypothetical protein